MKRKPRDHENATTASLTGSYRSVLSRGGAWKLDGSGRFFSSGSYEHLVRVDRATRRRIRERSKQRHCERPSEAGVCASVSGKGGTFFPRPPRHRHCHARRARPTRKTRGRSNDQKTPSKIVIAAEVGGGSNLGDASASSAGMKHANSGDEGDPPAIPIPKRRRTAEKSVPRGAVGKGKKAAAAAAEDDVNSLFWLVEVRRATSRRPPRPPERAQLDS